MRDLRSTARFSIACAITAGAAIAAGCGGSDGISRADVPEEFVAALCDRFTDCPGTGFDATIIRILIEASPAGTCENAFGASLDAVDIYDAQIDAGTIRYDAGAASDCLRALRNT